MVAGGLDYTYIGKIERGEQLPSLKMLVKISEALAVPLGHFLQEPHPPAGEEMVSPAARRLLRSEPGRELIKALTLLHDDDLPLVTEIVRVLSRHRRAGEGEDRFCAMAAEEGVSYTEKP